MDTFRMLVEAQRRLKDCKDTNVGLVIRGFPRPVTGEIVEINKGSGYVEIRPARNDRRACHILAALDAVCAVYVPNRELDVEA